MKRTIRFLSVSAALAATTFALVGTAGGASSATMAQAKAAGWDCSPEITIGGYYHCAPRGRASVADLIAGTTVPMIVLRAYNPGPTDEDRTFAGIETLIRADLYAGQPCPQDGLATWDGPVFGYYACHRFDT